MQEQEVVMNGSLLELVLMPALLCRARTCKPERENRGDKT